MQRLNPGDIAVIISIRAEHSDLSERHAAQAFMILKT